MSDARQELGKTGEELACQELRRRGYEIVDRRYRRRGGEIDIVARDGATTVFVEVKARQSDEFGAGADAITDWKRRKLTFVALDYLSRHRLHDTPARFDVVSIAFSAGTPAIEVYQNAFDIG